MASLVCDPNGRKRVVYFDAAGDRKTVRLGKIAKQQALAVKTRIEFLVAGKINGTAPDPDTSSWVASIGDDLHAKLAKQGLVTPRVKLVVPTLAAFLDAYIEGRNDIKPNTHAHLKRARNDLVKFFGADRLLNEITPGDADDFRRQLTGAENTIRRTCGRAKQFFRAAVRKRLIPESPFADMRGTNVRENRSRDYFITREEAQTVLDACPDSQWKLIFALSRYGGLRCPSEHLGLRWGDVNWTLGRITVRSPKTAHHEGHEERVVPLFPELREALQTVWNELPEDFDPKERPLSKEPVITRYRERNSNLRTQLIRIIKRASLKPWPKLFQNLRATRATELAESFPAHVAAEWLGHSTVIADKHYRQTTDEHFARAVGQTAPEDKQDANGRPSDGHPNTGPGQPGGEAAHFPAHNTTQYVGMGQNGSEQEHENPGDCDNHRDSVVFLAPPVGLEPTTKRLTAARSTN